MAFVKASKKRGKLRMALVGVSGSGKTYSALAIASALGGRVAVIDTEHGSASKYASGKPFDFDVLELTNYAPKNYVEAMHEAEAAGYDVIVLDSLSHAWVGKGGALEMKDVASRRAGENSYTAWRHVTPEHNALIDAMLQTRMHVIATMRAKQEFVIEKDEKTGKSVPRKVGMGSVQRDGMEYEFDVVGDLDQDHVLTVTKTRCPELADQAIRRPGRELAQQLLGWLSDGVDVAQATSPVPASVPSAASEPLSPGVDVPAMNGEAVPPLPAPKTPETKPYEPTASLIAVNAEWERLKAKYPKDGLAKEMWTEAVKKALGAHRPSSTWSVKDLEAVKTELWATNTTKAA